MHKFELPQDLMQRVSDRVGRAHPFDVVMPQRTALLVVDMQNYFVKQGFMGEVSMAREIVPGINRLARAVRQAGGHVVWIKNSTNDTLQSWSVYHQHLLSPPAQKRRYETMTEGHEGHELWGLLEPALTDAQIIKKRFSAFIQGSSGLADHLHKR
ncbi:MAG: isochorismatase family protein, partial [Thermomicrobiales bacterium]